MYRALAWTGGPEAIGFLIGAAGEPSSPARMRATWALGLVPEESTEVDRALAALVQDPDPQVSAGAQWAIAERGRRGESR